METNYVKVSNHLFSRVLVMIDTLFDDVVFSKILFGYGFSPVYCNERCMHGTLLFKGYGYSPLAHACG